MTSTNAEVDPDTSHNDKLELVLSDSDDSSATASDNLASVIEQEDELMRERSVATSAYQVGDDMIIEDQYGEIMRVVAAKNKDSPYSSSASSSGSPFSSSSSVKNKDQQVYVHHIDKNITIEDTEGDVLRKYKIKNINKEPQTKKKLKAATDKTLLKMKLKKGSPLTTKKSPRYILQESFDNDKQESPLRNEKVEKKLENKLNLMINQ